MRSHIDRMRDFGQYHLWQVAVLICAILSGLSEECIAGDGQRKGLVLGAGLGLTMSHSRLTGYDIGPGFEMKIGYAPTDRVLLYFTSLGVIIVKGRDNILIEQKSAFAISYFIAPAAPSLFMSGGIFPDRLVGLGYEFKTGRSVEAVYIVRDIDFTGSSSLAIRINFLRF